VEHAALFALLAIFLFSAKRDARLVLKAHTAIQRLNASAKRFA
jgi:hypothetical protein